MIHLPGIIPRLSEYAQSNDLLFMNVLAMIGVLQDIIEEDFPIESMVGDLPSELKRPRFIGTTAVGIESQYTFDLNQLAVPMDVSKFYVKIKV